jgi:hypothetical protein
MLENVLYPKYWGTFLVVDIEGCYRDTQSLAYTVARLTSAMRIVFLLLC